MPDLDHISVTLPFGTWLEVENAVQDALSAARIRLNRATSPAGTRSRQAQVDALILAKTKIVDVTASIGD